MASVRLKSTGKTIYFNGQGALPALRKAAKVLEMKNYLSGFGCIFVGPSRADLAELVSIVNDELAAA